MQGFRRNIAGVPWESRREIVGEASGDMLNALEAILKIIPRELAEGNIVELGDFGNFWLRLETEGEDTADGVNASNIKEVLVRFTPGRLFKQTLDSVQFSKAE